MLARTLCLNNRVVTTKEQLHPPTNPHTNKPLKKETFTSNRFQPGPCNSRVPPVILLLNKSYTSYLPVTEQHVRSGVLIRILPDRSVSITVTYDGLPDTVVKKLLSNRHVVRFHSPRS